MLTAQNTTARPDARHGAHHAVGPVGRHGRLHDLQRLAQGRDLEHVQTGAQQQVGELDGLLLELACAAHARGGRGGGHASLRLLEDMAGPRQVCGFFAWLLLWCYECREEARKICTASGELVRLKLIGAETCFVHVLRIATSTTHERIVEWRVVVADGVSQAHKVENELQGAVRALSN